MKNKKMKTMIVSLAMVGAVGLGSTLAYLSDKTNTLTNTFTVGTGFIPGDNDLAVWIDETTVNTKSDGLSYMGRTLEGNIYEKVLPGDILVKDPVLRVNKGSIKSYVYIQVSGLDQLATAGIKTSIDKTKWTKVTSDGHTADKTRTLDGIYRYQTILDPTNDVAATTALFTELAVDEGFKGQDAQGNTISLQNVVIKGCAVQAIKTVGGVETIIPLIEVEAPLFQ